MKQIISIALLVVAALSFSACAPAEPTATSSATTAATAAASRPAENVEQAIAQLEREWVEAGVKGDIAALDRILADDWLMTSWDNQTVPKAQSLEEVKSGAYKPESINLDNIKVRAFGDVAVVTLSQTEKSKYKGQDSSGHYLYTDVWVKRNGKWQVVATHGSKVAQPKS